MSQKPLFVVFCTVVGVFLLTGVQAYAEDIQGAAVLRTTTEVVTPVCVDGLPPAPTPPAGLYE